MRLGLTLSLVSSFQIFQQSVINEMRDIDRKDIWFSIASAAFPLGQFISTLFLAFRPVSAKRGLIADSWFLIVGSIITLIPSWSILCIGRFLVGCGAGIGFVCVTIVLYDEIPYITRPAHFLVLGLAFAFGTLVINITPIVNVPDIAILIFASALSAASGIVYLLLQSKSTYKLDSLTSEDSESLTSSFPSMLVYVLMALNVSIGVPATLAFSKGIFEKFGLNSDASTYLSIGFPLVQMILILILYISVLDRKILIVGGYIVAVLLQAILLVTSFYPYLPEMHKTIAMSSLFWLLAVVCCVPCNTALCLITATVILATLFNRNMIIGRDLSRYQFPSMFFIPYYVWMCDVLRAASVTLGLRKQFASSNEQMIFGSRGRALMWVLATVSTGTFTWTMEKYGFTACFAPYVVISAVLLFVLIMIYPRKTQESH